MMNRDTVLLSEAYSSILAEQQSFNEESAGYEDLANVVANNENLLSLMGKEGLTEADLNDNTNKFFNFIIRHLKRYTTNWWI